ncbi:MAG: tetratricopeptide repeat protein [Minicystis sp.]
MRKAKDGEGPRRMAEKATPRPVRRSRSEPASGAKPRTSKRRASGTSGKSSTRKRSEPERTKRARPTTERRSTRAARPKKTTAPVTSAGAKTAASSKRAAPPREKASEREAPSPEEMLQRAMAAHTPRARGLWARRGLASARRIGAVTQSMLLRQLYLAYYEERRFAKALEVSRQNIELSVLPDVAHQDAARAAQALGDIDAAAGHLRLAARTGPPKRRAFHLWTLGSLYLLAGRHAEAISALSRAARWGTTDKPLYQGHLAVARCAGGEPVDNLPELIQKLAAVPAGQGYGRFVLGHLAFYAHRWDDARGYLEAFIARSTGGRTALAIALDGEVALARQTLAQLPKT